MNASFDIVQRGFKLPVRPSGIAEKLHPRTASRIHSVTINYSRFTTARFSTGPATGLRLIRNKVARNARRSLRRAFHVNVCLRTSFLGPISNKII